MLGWLDGVQDRGLAAVLVLVLPGPLLVLAPHLDQLVRTSPKGLLMLTISSRLFELGTCLALRKGRPPSKAN